MAVLSELSSIVKEVGDPSSRSSEEEVPSRPLKSSSGAAGTPNAGFVVKIVANGQRHYINMCSHQSVGKPINAQDQEMPDEHLKLRGIDNLRVPLLTSAARTHVMPSGEGEALCFDVVFCPVVIEIALVVPPEEGADQSSGPPPSQHAIQLGKVRRSAPAHHGLRPCKPCLASQSGKPDLI